MFKKLSLAAALLGSSMVSGFAPSNNNNNKLFGVSSQRTTSSTPLSMVAIDTSDIKNGLTVELDGEPYKVLSFSIMKQARGAAKTTIKFKNLMRGTTIENTYRSGEKFETAMVEKKKAQFTYPDENGNFFFMDMETFDEVMIEAPLVEDVKEWITEGLECDLITFKEKCIEGQCFFFHYLFFSCASLFVLIRYLTPQHHENCSFSINKNEIQHLCLQ